MLKEAIGEAETIEKAQEEACKNLGVNIEDAEFEIIQTPTKKVLGLFGGKTAKVKAYITKSGVQQAKSYVQSIINLMGLSDVSLNVLESENGTIFDLQGEHINCIIGKRGETLDSLQYLTNLVANKGGKEPYTRITINAGSFRKKREKVLEELAKKMANKALRTHKLVSLEHMNPYERRIIHTAIQNIHGVTSWSEGESYNRHVVIGINKNKYKNSSKKSTTQSVENSKDTQNTTQCTTSNNATTDDINSDAKLYGKINM